jgi:hypothetical protein
VTRFLPETDMADALSPQRAQRTQRFSAVGNPSFDPLSVIFAVSAVQYLIRNPIGVGGIVACGV